MLIMMKSTRPYSSLFVIEVGKDADFLVFNNDLLTAAPEGFSHNMPAEVYIGGRKVK